MIGTEDWSDAHLSGVVKSLMNFLLRRGVKNSDITDLSLDLKEANGTFTLEIKSKTLVADRQIIRRKGRDWVRIIFVFSLLVMLVFVVTGMLDPNVTGGRSLVYIGLYPAFVVNTLGARYVIKKLMA
jgi:hypothetical protein